MRFSIQVGKMVDGLVMRVGQQALMKRVGRTLCRLISIVFLLGSPFAFSAAPLHYYKITDANDSSYYTDPAAACAIHGTSIIGFTCYLGANPSGSYIVDAGTLCPDYTSPDTSKALAQQCADPHCPTGPGGQSADSCFANKNTGNTSQCPISTGTKRPIHGSTGNKYWTETDYAFAGATGFAFTRQYNSQNTGVTGPLGTAWRHNYNSIIRTGPAANGAAAILVARANGTAYAFIQSGNSYASEDAGITDQLSAITNAGGVLLGWKYKVAADNSTENYDAAGRLWSITSRTGLTQRFMYSSIATPAATAPKPGLLLRAIDAFGQELSFTYDSNSRIKTVKDPQGRQYQYSYDTSNNLAAITYPDNKTKYYLYNEPTYTNGANLPNALTGVIDENGIRYASYRYNAQGKAYAEEQAGGVNQYTLTYSSDGSSTTITDPLGTARTTSFTTILGAIKATGQSQPGGAGCGAAANTVAYDANGNVAALTDFKGNQTTYAYDTLRNLETSRVEASGTPQARTISMTWHATYRLPTAIAEPKRLTTFAYDTLGNLLTKTARATNDATGAQGFSAATVGVARNWTYTYNSVGQVLTATGPRTDVLDKTTYAYNAQGNLTTVTNALNQVTTLSNYDANGQVGRITDANGTTTDMSYSARGWLLSKVVTSAGGTPETTSYQYDGVGQLTQITLPDGASIAYTYDPAHRLTSIADNLGNSIAYTLDAMGNRTSEQVKDPAGTLTRQTTRVYDALNRLQTVTGGTR